MVGSHLEGLGAVSLERYWVLWNRARNLERSGVWDVGAREDLRMGWGRETLKRVVRGNGRGGGSGRGRNFERGIRVG